MPKRTRNSHQPPQGGRCTPAPVRAEILPIGISLGAPKCDLGPLRWPRASEDTRTTSSAAPTRCWVSASTTPLLHNPRMCPLIMFGRRRSAVALLQGDARAE